MLKAVLAATAAVAIAGSTLAYAQRDGRPDEMRRGGDMRRGGPSADDIRAFQAARLAALRAGLALTPEQERHWPAFETAMRELQSLRLKKITARREARTDAGPSDPAENMRRRASRLAENGAVLGRLADAMGPLYRSLDEAQKRRFAALSRVGRQQGFRGQRGQQWRGRDGGKERFRGEPGGDSGERGKRRSEAPIDAPVELMPSGEPIIGGPGVQVPSGRRTGVRDGI